MSKMTTEQFLSHLGIEVGKPYLRNCRKETIVNVYTQSMSVAIECEDEEGEIIKYSKNLLWFINQEITPLPKYTLSENQILELKYVLSIGYLYLRRSYLTGSLYACSKYPSTIEERDILYVRNDYNFVESKDESLIIEKLLEGQKVSLDELRKCL